MSNRLRRLFRSRLLAVSLILAAVLYCLAVQRPRPAHACPSQQTWITYYTDATYSTACGDKVYDCQCDVFREGCQTSYYTVEYYPCP